MYSCFNMTFIDQNASDVSKIKSTREITMETE